MAEYVLPLAALAGLANAAPQLGLNLGGAAGAGAGAQVGVPAVSTPRLSTSLPTARASSVVAGGAAGVLPSLPVSVPAVTGVASILPVSLPSASALTDLTGVPAILLSSLPTGSVPVTYPTTLPVTATALIASLGSLPVNAPATSAVNSLLASATSGLPAITTPNLGVGGALDIDTLLDTLGDAVFAEVASSFADLFATVTSAAGSALQTPDPAAVLGALQGVSGATSAVGGLTSGLPVARSADEAEVKEVKEKRQGLGLGALTGVLGGLGGSSGGSPLSAVTDAVGSVTGAVTGSALNGGAAPLAPVTNIISGLANGQSGLGALTNIVSSLTGLLSGSDPVSVIMNILSGGLLNSIPGMGGITDSLPIGTLTSSLGGLSAVNDVVMGVVDTVPLPDQLDVVVDALGSVSSLDLATILADTPQLAQISALTSMGTTLAAVNPSTLGSLSTVTNPSMIQSLAMLTDTFDLATILYVLTSATDNLPILSSRDAAVKNVTSRVTSAASIGIPIPLGRLLESPSSMFAVINEVQPMVSCLPCVFSFTILEQLGLLNVQDIVSGLDTSAVTGVLSNLPLPTKKE